MSQLSWLFFNVGVPVFAPVALLPLIGFSSFYRHESRGIAARSIQDGQLLWVVISMCASACYEIGSALGHATNENTLAFMLAGMIWHVGFMIVSSILLMFGTADAIFASENIRNTGRVDRNLMWVSIAMTTLSAASFSFSHYSLT